MVKKNKKNENLPEGMSRRQAKLAARAAERAALEKDATPYAGIGGEADLIALQEFVHLIGAVEHGDNQSIFHHGRKVMFYLRDFATHSFI